MSQVNNSVFICYRRANSFHALAVYQNLSQYGYDVFIDYQNIDAGDFEHIILDNIRARAHFLIILTPSALERCNEPGDWLRREIEFALDHKRNIVPLMFEGFDYNTPAIGKYLTGRLQVLTRYNAQRVPADFFEAAMEKVRNRFLKLPVDAIIHPLSGAAQKIALEQQAMANRQAAVTEQTLTAEGYFERALALPRNDPKGKIAGYSKAIYLRPDYADAYNNRGIAYDDMGDFRQAIADYNKAIRLKPEYADAYYNRGNAFLSRRHYKQALHDYAKAIRLKPDYAEAFMGGGLVYFSTERYTMAIAAYTRALQLMPHSAKAYLNRGNAYCRKQQYVKAIADYTRSIELNNPELELVYNNRGLAYYEMGDIEHAIADYEYALRINPEDTVAQENLKQARQMSW